MRGPCADSPPVPRKPFCFSLSGQHSVHPRRESTPCYNIGSVFDHFAQAQVNVSVLSTFRTAGLSYDVREVRCMTCIFHLGYFQFTVGLSGRYPHCPGRSVFSTQQTEQFCESPRRISALLESLICVCGLHPSRSKSQRKRSLTRLLPSTPPPSLTSPPLRSSLPTRLQASTPPCCFSKC